MTNVVRRLFGRRPAVYDQAPVVNHEGFPAWRRTPEEEYLQVLLTNSLGHTFYASVGENYAVAQAVHQAMLLRDPGFAARAIVYAREQGTMRLQPIIGLVYLSLVDRAAFRAIFDRVILTPGDLLDFVQIVKSKQIRPGLGRSVKEAVNAWLNRISEYHVIKYGSSSGAKLTLRDVLRLTHPQPADEQHDAIFLYLTDRGKWRDRYGERIAELLPQIHAVELLKATSDMVEARALIAAGRLPYEVVTGVIKPDVETWSSLMRQMPQFALLRHLNALKRAGVLANDDLAGYVADRLADVEALRKAKMLPFRLHAGWVAFEPANAPEQRVKRALETAIEATFANMPRLEGVIAIAPDVSGSMSSSIHAPSKVRYIDIAAIFAAALLKASPTALVLPFETAVVDVALHPAQPLMAIVDALAKIGGGGTAVSAPVSKLLHDRTPVDVFIGITDNVEWARDNYGGQGFLPVWRKYRAAVAPQARAFLLTIAPYQATVAPPDEPGITFLYGWAEHVPALIAQELAGYAGQVEAVRQTVL